MLKQFFEKYSDRFVSRWIILLIDTFIIISTLFLAKVVRHNFRLEEIDWSHFGIKLVSVSGIYLIFFILFRSYAGIVRHTNLTDTIRLFKASIFAFLTILTLQNVFSFSLGYRTYFVSLSVLLIHYFVSIVILVMLRLAVKAIYYSVAESVSGNKKNVLIYGAGQSGMITLSTLMQDSLMNYSVVGFIDDNPTKIGKTIGGLKVYSAKDALNGMLKERKVEEVILSIQNISQKRKSEIIDTCIALDLNVKTIPPINKWINGELSSGQIKNVRIEDLLNREQIVLDTKNIISQLSEKVIIVTGAAGSIGSEISKQVLSYQPSKIILIDQAETPLFELEHQISKIRQHCNAVIKFVIADVQNETTMRRIFSTHKPNIVFHAAAYKHVPLMEGNPFEAVRVNILGTKLLADLSLEFSVEKFIMISTDKAVNPTNVMGATKRTAEIYTQSLNTLNYVKTSFITTRFGNVLGSNGSVIPLFKKQIEAGGPVTVTHPDITRYFMTIPEACQLVLEAGAMGKGGEIFIFDMGESVKIIDVAKKMIKMYGLKLGKDIQIEITGLRPGEKLYEELLNVEENTQATYNPQIMIAKIAPHSYEDITSDLEKLSVLCKSGTDFDIVHQLKQIVREFKSNNSIYEKLDDIQQSIPEKIA